MPPENQQQQNTTANPTTPSTATPVAVPHKPAPVTTPDEVLPAQVVPPLPAQTLQANPAMPTTSQASVPEVAEQLSVPQSLGGQAQKPITVVTPVQLTFEEEIAQKEEEQKKHATARIAIEEESEKLFTSKKELEEKVAPILLEEKLSIEHIEELEKERLATTDPHEARTLETRRWEEEERRRGIEHRRWEVAAELEELNKKIHDKELSFNSLLAQESECAMQIDKLKIKIQQRDLARALESITSERVATEEEHEHFLQEHERLVALLSDLTTRENETRTAEDVVEQKTVGVGTLYEEQVLATERRKLEDARRSAEQQRWEAEDAMIPNTQSLAESERHLAEIKIKEAELLAKQKALGSQ